MKKIGLIFLGAVLAVGAVSWGYACLSDGLDLVGGGVVGAMRAGSDNATQNQLTRSLGGMERLPE